MEDWEGWEGLADLEEKVATVEWADCIKSERP